MFNPRSLRQILLLAAAFALTALGLALISQYGFNLHPCELCLYQRWPYVGVAAVAVVAAVLAERHPGVARAALALCAALFLLDAGIAAYHAGVEWGVFEGLDTCAAGELPPGASLEDVRAQLLNAPLVSCRDAAFRFLGLSMAGWNALYALAAAAIAARSFKEAEIDMLRRRVGLLFVIVLLGGWGMSAKAESPMIANQGLELSTEEIVQFQKEALAGSGELAFRLHQYYEFVQVNSNESLYWVTVSAENGNAAGQYNLGFKLHNSLDPRSKVRARFWLDMARKNGERLASDLLKEIGER